MKFFVEDKDDLKAVLNRINQELPSYLKHYGGFFIDLEINLDYHCAPPSRHSLYSLEEKDQQERDSYPLIINAENLSLTPPEQSESKREELIRHHLNKTRDPHTYTGEDFLNDKLKEIEKEYEEALDNQIKAIHKTEIYRKALVKIIREEHPNSFIPKTFRNDLMILEAICQDDPNLKKRQEKIYNDIKDMEDLKKLNNYYNSLSDEND